jgi:hypothetical protein
MAWRVDENLVSGRLDNRVPGKVTGELRFIGMKEPVRVDLDGDFSGTLRGKVLVLNRPEASERNATLGRSGSYMEQFDAVQEGRVESIAADETLAHIAWLSTENGRVVIELDPNQCTVEG